MTSIKIIFQIALIPSNEIILNININFSPKLNWNFPTLSTLLWVSRGSFASATQVNVSNSLGIFASLFPSIHRFKTEKKINTDRFSYGMLATHKTVILIANNLKSSR